MKALTRGEEHEWRTTHEPVSPAVRPGETLAAGAPLGALLAGHPGCPAPACLHWGLREGNVSRATRAACAESATRSWRARAAAGAFRRAPAC